MMSYRIFRATGAHSGIPRYHHPVKQPPAAKPPSERTQITAHCATRLGSHLCRHGDTLSVAARPPTVNSQILGERGVGFMVHVRHEVVHHDLFELGFVDIDAGKLRLPRPTAHLSAVTQRKRTFLPLLRFAYFEETAALDRAPEGARLSHP
ncbi:uncharacterized protein BcabD6B2_51780 [Babesia caballi]|uniref:Uncharacterized protein n=1 Tax=Babesia caballi TaxID=5871 RepID=A0AAV4M014_BABCB|nr:hypothetical protein BcabD6B2_51780 [Babesia caballi]